MNFSFIRLFCPIFLVTFSLYGCFRNVTLPYTQWHTSKITYTANPGSSNAFDDYTIAAVRAEELVGKHLYRVNFTPGIKKNILDKLENPLNLIRTAYHKRCDFIFDSLPAFQEIKFQKGWRMLGLALEWSIENSIYLQNFEQASLDLLVATKFGFDLAAGSATDVSLGMNILKNARKTFLPALSQLQPHQLKKIALELIKILHDCPQIEKALMNEQEKMMAGVQFVQDCYQKKNFSLLTDNLGSNVQPAIKYLHKKIAKKDGLIRVKYFEGFVQEAKNCVSKLLTDCKKPMIQRTKEMDVHKKSRPWHRFAQHFFSGAKLILVLYDRELSKTRLLALETLLREHIQIHKKAPANLNSFPKNLIIDPFSGQPFVYREGDIDFKIYSIGENLRDDGGQTDEAGLYPDLMLEF